MLKNGPKHKYLVKKKKKNRRYINSCRQGVDGNDLRNITKFGEGKAEDPYNFAIKKVHHFRFGVFINFKETNMNYFI